MKTTTTTTTTTTAATMTPTSSTTGTTTTTTTGTTTTTTTSLEDILSVEDIFHRCLLSFLTPQDLGRLEVASSTLYYASLATQDNDFATWKILCERDFAVVSNDDHNNDDDDDDESQQQPQQQQQQQQHNKAAPVLNPQKRSFDSLEEQSNWKVCYEKWTYWNHWTGRHIKARDMVRSIALWTRFKAWLEQHSLHNILDSLKLCPPPSTFQSLVQNKDAPSSLLALYAVHGGQAQDADFFAGMFGSYSCYNDFYSLRLVDVQFFEEHSSAHDDENNSDSILIGISPGNPRIFLNLAKPTDQNPGLVTLTFGRHRTGPHQALESPMVVGREGGILTYFEHYIDQLEAGIYRPSCTIPTALSSRSIGLFPDHGNGDDGSDDDDDKMVSCCVTRGVEVKASARWFPSPSDGFNRGLNFGYSIRIRMVATVDPEETSTSNEDSTSAVPNSTTSSNTTCQLVGRHWQFMDGNGTVRRVDGEAVIGKQPLFFINAHTGKSGFQDLGDAGDEEIYDDTTFCYASQSGPVEGTSQADTKLASVQGTFSFVPGSIENPQGPIFHVLVGKFPLRVPSPFY